VSLACIASTAFKGKGKSIVATNDRRHISRQTGLNAYIKSGSLASTEDISYPGVWGTDRLQPAIQEKKWRKGVCYSMQVGKNFLR